jgi:DMSO/TMAO reductase YedYZ molybdopterin-dependent catalytic subunit
MVVPEPVLEFPLAPEQNTAFVTPSDKLFVLAHLGVPQIHLDSWSFDVAGLVSAPLSLRYSDLERFTAKNVSTVFQCAGNPLDPTKPFRLVANLEWRGVLLREILELAEVDPSCQYVWAYGLDHGAFFTSPHQEHYVKDLPLEYVMTHDVIVATHLNGKSLSPKHGFPARIVAPGYYGTNSVKWLCRIEAENRRANGHFTRELYNDAIPGTDATRPVWGIAPESVIVSPGNGSELQASGVLISGWAWSLTEITTVEVSTDGGKTWAPAEVEVKENGSWQRFRYQWAANHAGHCELLSRATDRDGRTQPIDGARNAVHRVGVTVVSE